MPTINRVYESVILDHFRTNQQMIFLGGPRQVGKTTIAENLQSHWSKSIYLNWDDEEDRLLILAGAAAIVERFELHVLAEQKTLVIFDEIHKYPQWKNFLKGFYDKNKQHVQIVVTGSAQLDTLRKGGDSLMGRYFPLRVHPFSVGECLHVDFGKKLIHEPQRLSAAKYESLMKYGGFPDPFIKANTRFHRQWTQARHDQLLREDVRDLSRIHELSHLGVLMLLLRQNAGQLVNYTALASLVHVSIETIRNWMSLLEGFYYCFSIQPYSKNLNRTLRKNPKIYLWDWSLIKDVGARNENMLACHLLKSVHFWTDCGLGYFELYFIRDKEKREVDFLITRDEIPWILIEAKTNNNAKINPHLEYYQKLLKPEHCFQVAVNLDYVDQDCFKFHGPIIVPAHTLLSQLV